MAAASKPARQAPERKNAGKRRIQKTDMAERGKACRNDRHGKGSLVPPAFPLLENTRKHTRMNQDHSKLEAVYSGTRIQAEIIKGMLEANQIPSMLKDESLSAFFSTSRTACGSVKVLVNPEDRRLASRLIEENPIEGMEDASAPDR